MTFHHTNPENYVSHTIAHVHNIVHVSCYTWTYFFQKHTEVPSKSWFSWRVQVECIATKKYFNMFILIDMQYPSVFPREIYEGNSNKYQNVDNLIVF